MRKKVKRTKFSASLDVLGYIMAVIVGVGLIAKLWHIFKHHL